MGVLRSERQDELVRFVVSEILKSERLADLPRENYSKPRWTAPMIQQSKDRYGRVLLILL